MFTDRLLVTLADVLACAEAENVTLRIDGAETQVRRPKAGRPGRAAFGGLASEFPDQVSAPPRKPKNLGEGATTEQYGWRQAKRRQSSRRSPANTQTPNCVNGAPLQRRTGRRQDYAETHCAIAGLVSDRAANRAARHRRSTELVPAFPTDCRTA